MRPLNELTSAAAAAPASSLPEAALRFATPWIVRRSGTVKVDVSDSGNNSIAAGGDISVDEYVDYSMLEFAL